MNRRDFLRRLTTGGLGLAVAAHTLDLERLLWVPGQMVAVPANYGLSVDWLSRETLLLLSNQLTVSASLNREYDARFVARGGTVHVRYPKRCAA